MTLEGGILGEGRLEGSRERSPPSPKRHHSQGDSAVPRVCGRQRGSELGPRQADGVLLAQGLPSLNGRSASFSCRDQTPNWWARNPMAEQLHREARS